MVLQNPRKQSYLSKQDVVAQVLLCSVSGEIFPKAEDEQERAQLGLSQGTDVRQAYLSGLLGITLPWITPPEQALHTAAANSEAELLDACRWGCLNSFLPVCAAQGASGPAAYKRAFELQYPLAYQAGV